jgi:hypothetical protein
MRCQCCGEEADTVLETELCGVSFMCADCSDAWFIAKMSAQLPVIENELA